MSFRTLLLVAGLLALGFGAGFLALPAPLLSFYGVTTDSAGLFMSRFFGAALVELGLVLWFARGATDRSLQRAIALAGTLGSVVGLCVAVYGQLAGLVNGMGWSSVAIYAALLLGYASIAFGQKA
jgi:hypothetical protein